MGFLPLYSLLCFAQKQKPAKHVRFVAKVRQSLVSLIPKRYQTAQLHNDGGGWIINAEKSRHRLQGTRYLFEDFSGPFWYYFSVLLCLKMINAVAVGYVENEVLQGVMLLCTQSVVFITPFFLDINISGALDNWGLLQGFCLWSISVLVVIMSYFPAFEEDGKTTTKVVKYTELAIGNVCQVLLWLPLIEMGFEGLTYYQGIVRLRVFVNHSSQESLHRVRERLHRFYMQYCPEKASASNLDRMLGPAEDGGYEGWESEMFDELISMYGPELAGDVRDRGGDGEDEAQTGTPAKATGDQKTNRGGAMNDRMARAFQRHCAHHGPSSDPPRSGDITRGLDPVAWTRGMEENTSHEVVVTLDTIVGIEFSGLSGLDNIEEKGTAHITDDGGVELMEVKAAKPTEHTQIGVSISTTAAVDEEEISL